MKSKAMRGKSPGILWLALGILAAVNSAARAEAIVDGQALWVHDPMTIRCGEYFYVFSTGNSADPLLMRRSRNLHNWETLGAVIPDVPAWVQARISGVSNLWAPDAIYHNGRYYLNYSGSQFGTNTSTIGLLSNATLDPASPDYEWVDEGEIISSAGQNVYYNTIDGAFFRAPDGQMWLAFGSFWGGIKLTPLNSATMKPTTTPATLYSIAGRPSTAIEAPYLYYRNGYYYLFVNWDTCCQGVDSTYNIRVGRSASVTGPYRDRSGTSMISGGGTLVLSSGQRWIGPGHACIVTVDGQDFFSYHAYDALHNGRHTLRVNYLEWDAEGWPVVAEPVEPAPGEVIGQWDFEDGTPGAPMNDTGRTGQVGSEDLSGNDFHMYAWDASYGPSFSAAGATPTGEGLSSRHNGGQDGYLSDTFICGWSPTAWTIELAVKLDHLSGWQTMIGRNGSSQGEAEADFYFQKQDVSDRFRINLDTVGGQRYILDADFTVEAGRWYRLAAVSDGATLTLYADRLDGAGSRVVGTLALNAANDNALAASDDSWTFGRGWFNGSQADHITGNLDDIRFTDRALSPTEFMHYRPLEVTETEGNTQVSERGATSDTFTVRLNHNAAWPALAGDVTVTLSTDGQVEVEPSSLVFTATGWQTAQTVTVTAVDDSTLETDPHTAAITYSLSSSDGRYQGLSGRAATVTILENECGAWGYLPGDLNLDCRVDLDDVAVLGAQWTASLEELAALAGDWLATTEPYVPGAVYGSQP